MSLRAPRVVGNEAFSGGVMLLQYGAKKGLVFCFIIFFKIITTTTILIIIVTISQTVRKLFSEFHAFTQSDKT